MSEHEGGHVERPGPGELTDPLIREELKRAGVWLGLATLIVAIVFLIEPLLLIVGGLVFAAVLDGGTRLLGRVLPIARGLRLTLVVLLALAALAGFFWLGGVQLSGQAETFREVITLQLARLETFLESRGLLENVSVEGLGNQVMSSIGRLTSAVTGLLGAITSMVMIIVVGVFIAVEPLNYERGIAWMLPMRSREAFYRVSDRIGWTLRRLMAGRLLGMAVEGVGTWILLMLGGVPMAAFLGMLTGLLAFIPNIGAIISGALIILVGFSVDTQTGLYGFAVYLAVQMIDGYLIIPYVARKTVDLAPAVVLGAQLLFGALFGILGLALADPIVAMIKAALEQKTREDQMDGEALSPRQRWLQRRRGEA